MFHCVRFRIFERSQLLMKVLTDYQNSTKPEPINHIQAREPPRVFLGDRWNIGCSHPVIKVTMIATVPVFVFMLADNFALFLYHCLLVNWLDLVHSMNMRSNHSARFNLNIISEQQCRTKNCFIVFRHGRASQQRKIKKNHRIEQNTKIDDAAYNKLEYSKRQNLELPTPLLFFV